MAVDYAKIKALSKQLLECIGDDPEGEDPSIPKQDNAINDGGQEPNTKFLQTAGNSNAKEDMVGPGDSKKKKDSSLAMMGAMLASKFKK